MSESGNPRKSWRRVPASFVVTNLDGGNLPDPEGGRPVVGTTVAQDLR